MAHDCLRGGAARRLIFIWVALCAIAWAWTPVAFAGESVFVVLDQGFSYDVGALSDLPQDKRLRAPIKRKVPLFFWTVIGGDERAIAELRAAGQFKIRHRWSVNCLGDRYHGEKTERALFVGGKRVDESKFDELVGLLESEIALNKQSSRGAKFDWRTRSEKQYVPACSYVVQVVDDHDEVLFCEKLGGPCRFDFNVLE